MLKTLELRNFRQHENLTLSFERGLVCMRGANESGKSTVIEGISFALFGSGALRDALDNVVTWGKPLKDMKVRLTVEEQGRTLTFTRGKNGAEVLEGSDVIVTGQKEVSNYAAEIFGGDLSTCSKLIFASQGNLRGSLSEGPKAAATLIEDLSGFDLFDKIIGLIQNKLMTGSDSVLAAQLRDAQETLATTEVPVKDGTPERKATKKAAEIEAKKAAAEAYDAPIAEYREWSQANFPLWDARSKALQEVEKLEQAKVETLDRLNRLKSQPMPALPNLDALRLDLEQARSWQKTQDAWAEFQKCPTAKNSWDGDRESFSTAYADAVIGSDKIKNTISEKKAEVAALNSKLILSLTCPTCGSEVKDAEKIRLQNEAIRSQVDALQADIKLLEDQLAWAVSALSAYAEIDKVDGVISRLLGKIGAYVLVGTDTVPPKLTWAGPPVASIAADVGAAERALESGEALHRADERHRGAVAAAAQDYAALSGKVIEVPDPVPLWDERNAEHAKNLSAQATLLSDVDNLNAELKILKIEVGHAEAAYRYATERIEMLKSQVTKSEKALAELAFNNTLLKKVRAARPVVGDKLWNAVLASVSTMFSQMRGEVSAVTRGREGFLVNGAPTSSLSGSTLDILGLAIRVALIKVFVPHAPVLILDEPCAALDAGRAEELLGFVASSGFDQVLLVTHENVSDAVANQLITL